MTNAHHAQLQAEQGTATAQQPASLCTSAQHTTHGHMAAYGLRNRLLPEVLQTSHIRSGIRPNRPNSEVVGGVLSREVLPHSFERPAHIRRPSEAQGLGFEDPHLSQRLKDPGPSLGLSASSPETSRSALDTACVNTNPFTEPCPVCTPACCLLLTCTGAAPSNRATNSGCPAGPACGHCSLPTLRHSASLAPHFIHCHDVSQRTLRSEGSNCCIS